MTATSSPRASPRTKARSLTRWLAIGAPLLSGRAEGRRPASLAGLRLKPGRAQLRRWREGGAHGRGGVPDRTQLLFLEPVRKRSVPDEVARAPRARRRPKQKRRPIGTAHKADVIASVSEESSHRLRSARQPQQWQAADRQRTATRLALRPGRNQSMALPTWIEPQLCKLAKKAPTGDRWIHEVKFDGYRMAARVDRDKVRLLTRNGLDWTMRYIRRQRRLSPSSLSRQPISTANSAPSGPTACRLCLSGVRHG